MSLFVLLLTGLWFHHTKVTFFLDCVEWDEEECLGG